MFHLVHLIVFSGRVDSYNLALTLLVYVVKKISLDNCVRITGDQR